MSSGPDVPEKLWPFFDSDLAEKLAQLRKDLHRNPELSFQEERTGERLNEELQQLKPAKLERVA
jgi:metal-dependent amidase/aminoacylase/carboxypeptidase family protein